MITSRPLWPGATDVDQLFRIVQNAGPLTPRFREAFERNPYLKGQDTTLLVPGTHSLLSRFDSKGQGTSAERTRQMKFVSQTLAIDPARRMTCTQLRNHVLFLRGADDETPLALDDPRYIGSGKHAKVSQRFERFVRYQVALYLACVDNVYARGLHVYDRVSCAHHCILAARYAPT